MAYDNRCGSDREMAIHDIFMTGLKTHLPLWEPRNELPVGHQVSLESLHVIRQLHRRNNKLIRMVMARQEAKTVQQE